MKNELVIQEYESHLEEMKQGFTEYYKEQSEVSIKWRHKMGTLLVEYAEQHGLPLRQHVQRVGNDLKREKSTMYYMASFAKKFPDIESAPIYEPWRDICHKYLDSPKEKSCEHEEEVIKRCKFCKILL